MEYNPEKEKLDGDLTQGENIADFGGLKFSFRAWKQALQEGKGMFSEQEIQQVFGKTSDQLYFENYAQIWCEVPPSASPEKDVHSPAPMRILGPLSHFKAFHEAYQCKPGDVFYPAPCQVW